MPMRWKNRVLPPWPTLAASAILWVPYSEVHADCPRYTLTISSADPCSYVATIPYGLNESGDVVGYYACNEIGAFAAWDAEIVTPLTLSDSNHSYAYDINASRRIVGAMDWNSVGVRAFEYFNGVGTNLGTLPGGVWSEAYAINGSNVIVGFSDLNGSTNRAVRWDDGVISDLNLPEGPSQAANDINDRGQIVGWMGKAAGGGFYSQGFSWIDGQVTPLGIPFNATNSNAKAVNNKGEICGIYAYPNTGGNGFIRRGVYWPQAGAAPIDIGLLPGYLRANPQDINDQGDIVGYLDNPQPVAPIKGFIRHDGQLLSLTDLLAPEWAGYKVTFTWAINNQGQIAAEVFGPGGSGIIDRAAVLTPVPPLVGDINCDWLVNIDDLFNVINGWGPCPRNAPCGSDIDKSGQTDIDDLFLVINNWS